MVTRSPQCHKNCHKNTIKEVNKLCICYVSQYFFKATIGMSKKVSQEHKQSVDTGRPNHTP